MKKIIIFCIINTAVFNLNLSAQTDEEKKEIIRTDANLKSGNYRDVLTNFFQLAFNDLTGTDKRLRFSSNLFALKLKTNPDLDIDYNFEKKTFWRNSNIDFDLKLDSNFRFNGASFGYKYALVNKRDYALAKDFSRLYSQTMAKYNNAFDQIMSNLAAQYGGNPVLLTKYNAEIYSFIKEKKGKFSDLSVEAQGLIKGVINDIGADESFNFGGVAQEAYNKLVESYKNKLLWTVAANFSTYSDGFMFSNIDLVSQATANLVKISGNAHLEFDAKATLAFLEDTARSQKNIERNTFAFEGGFNLAFTNRNNGKPIVEFKATTAYNSVLHGLYLNETKDKFTFNGTLRFRVTDNIWIPVTLKYDPDDSNVFGFLSIKSNFDWLKNNN